MTAILLAALLSASPQAWLDIPATAKAPAFRIRVTATAARFTVELEGAAGVDHRATGLHLWLADAALVRRRVDDSDAAERELAHVRSLQKEPDHQEAACRERMAAFVKLAGERLAILRDEDPFMQVLVHFPEAAPGPTDIREAVFVPHGAGWTVDLDAVRAMAVAGAELGVVSVGARLEPIASAKSGPITGPYSVHLPSSLRMPLQADVALDSLVAQGPGFTLRPTPKGYRLFARPDVGELGCFGVEATFNVPGDWAEPAIIRRSLPGGVDVRLFGTRLVLARGDRHSPAQLQLSSPEAASFELVDLQPVRERFVLVFTTGGPSRPGGGMGMCGAGTELDLVWLLLRADLSIERDQVVPIESCYTSVEPAPFDGGWQLSDFSKRLRSEVRYDPRLPLDGFRVKSAPLPE
jgi:hypothetical protein